MSRRFSTVALNGSPVNALCMQTAAMVPSDGASARMSCHLAWLAAAALVGAPQVVVVQRAQGVLLVGSKDGELVLHIACRHAGHKDCAQRAT